MHKLRESHKNAVFPLSLHAGQRYPYSFMQDNGTDTSLLSHGSCKAGSLKGLCTGLVYSETQSLRYYLVYYLALGLYQMLCKSGSLSPCYDERSAFGYELLRRHQIRVQRLVLALAVNAGILKQSDILTVSFCISLCYFTPRPLCSSRSFCLNLSSLRVASLGHVYWITQILSINHQQTLCICHKPPTPFQEAGI